jgi:hypothetical protein
LPASQATTASIARTIPGTSIRWIQRTTERPSNIAEVPPAKMQTTPQMVSHTARSVGEPVKKLETWELKESISATPKINRTIPATNTRIPRIRGGCIAFPPAIRLLRHASGDTSMGRADEAQYGQAIGVGATEKVPQPATHERRGVLAWRRRRPISHASAAQIRATETKDPDSVRPYDVLSARERQVVVLVAVGTPRPRIDAGHAPKESVG